MNKAKQFLLSLFALLSIATGAKAQDGVTINNENFPDDTFRNYVSTNFDLDGNGTLNNAEIAGATEIYAFSMGIKSLKGIEHFTSLQKLQADQNELTELDVTKCPDLYYLSATDNQLTAIDVSNCLKMYRLNLNYNKLTAIDVSKLTGMKEFGCASNQLTSIDVSKNTELDTLAVFVNQLKELDVTKCTHLVGLYCDKNQLTELEVTNCPQLGELTCNENLLTELDVTNCPQLKILDCNGNQLTALDLSQHAAIVELNCSGNQLTQLKLCPNGNIVNIYANLNCLKGNAVDDLIASLPAQESAFITTIDKDEPDLEQNVFTKDQVSALNAKGWTAYLWQNGEWIVDEGSDPTAISVPLAEPSADKSLYDLSGRKLSRSPRKGIAIRNGRKYIYK